MGKLVLYITAAFVLGGLMVAMPMCIGLSAYVLSTEPGEISPEAFLHAVYTGFVFYLCILWEAQESFEEKFPLWSRVIFFLFLPIVVMWFHESWSLFLSMLALSVIAAVAAYQMLVTVIAKRQSYPS